MKASLLEASLFNSVLLYRLLPFGQVILRSCLQFWTYHFFKGVFKGSFQKINEVIKDIAELKP